MLSVVYDESYKLALHAECRGAHFKLFLILDL
jgi:hypothetical protein